MIKPNHKFLSHLIKYSLVGGLNAVYTFVVYFILLKIVRIHYLLSFSISWISGVLATYIINFIWVFRPEQKLIFKNRITKYFIVYLTSYLLNMFLLRTIVEYCHWDPLIVQLFLIPLVATINFLGIKYWSMKPYEKTS